LELANADPRSVAVDALRWVVTHTLFTPSAGKAMELLARDQCESNKMAAICRNWDGLYGGGFKPLESMLGTVFRKSSHREAGAGHASRWPAGSAGEEEYRTREIPV